VQHEWHHRTLHSTGPAQHLSEQVAVHCAERGHLMAQIWISNMELFERLSQLLTNAKLQVLGSRC
tara:strand:- start:403 stop:597 length:195 start_codon:yes stop_codon:yes gene_type:complete